MNACRSVLFVEVKFTLGVSEWGYNSLFQLENLIIVNCLLVAAIMVLVGVL